MATSFVAAVKRRVQNVGRRTAEAVSWAYTHPLQALGGASALVVFGGGVVLATALAGKALQQRLCASYPNPPPRPQICSV